MSSCTVVSADFRLIMGYCEQPVVLNASLVISPTRKLSQLTIPLPVGYGSVCPDDGIKEWSIRQNCNGDVCDLTLRRIIKPGKRREVNCSIFFAGEFSQRRKMLVYKPPSATTKVTLEVLFLDHHQPRAAHTVVWAGHNPVSTAVTFTKGLELERQGPDASGQVFWRGFLCTQGPSPECLLGIVW